MRKIFTPLLLGAVLLTVGASAAPLRQADIADGTAWFLHVDFEEARNKKIELKTDGTDAKKTNGTDANPTATPLLSSSFLALTSSLTAYGTGQQGEGAILIRHRFPNEKLTALLRQKKSVTPPADDTDAAKPSYTVRTFEGIVYLRRVETDAGKAPYTVRTRDGGTWLAALPREGVVVIAATQKWLDTALDRLDTEKTISAPPAPSDSPKEIFTASADIARINANRKSVLAGTQNLRRVTIGAVAESEGILRVSLLADMSNPNAADSTAALVRSLFIAQTPRFPALEKATIEATDARLRVTATFPVEQLISGLAAERKLLENAIENKLRP